MSNSEEIARSNICHVLHTYAVAIDGRRMDDVRSCFVIDCEAVYRTTHLKGRDELLAYLAAASAEGESRHYVTTVQVDVAGDRASAESYAISCLLRAADDEPTMRQRGVHYRDVLVREAEQTWRIAQRTVTVDWEFEGLPLRVG
jgi:hypothetical protein